MWDADGCGCCFHGSPKHQLQHQPGSTAFSASIDGDEGYPSSAEGHLGCVHIWALSYLQWTLTQPSQRQKPYLGHTDEPGHSATCRSQPPKTDTARFRLQENLQSQSHCGRERNMPAGPGGAWGVAVHGVAVCPVGPAHSRSLALPASSPRAALCPESPGKRVELTLQAFTFTRFLR